MAPKKALINARIIPFKYNCCTENMINKPAITTILRIISDSLGLLPLEIGSSIAVNNDIDAKQLSAIETFDAFMEA